MSGARRLVVFLGTKAQYVKTAPLLRLLDARGVPYRLVDSGQHAALSSDLRVELGVRHPDVLLGGSVDVTRVGQAALWALGVARQGVDRGRLRRDVFGLAPGEGGVCVVHGDTPSTLLSALLARRAGLQVAHLEAGLRSHDLLHPFPEELVRLAVMRVADLLVAPDATAVAELARMRGVRGQVLAVGANSVTEALVRARGVAPAAAPGSGPVVMTTHRVENLRSTERVRAFVDLAVRLASRGPVTLVAHGPTEAVLAERGLDVVLRDAGVDVVPLQPHATFTAMLAAAPLVVTDGGSVQEECALLGVPTLLWRRRTERSDGLGANVVLSGYDAAVVDAVVADPDVLRRPLADLGATPSEQVLAALLARLRPTGATSAG